MPRPKSSSSRSELIRLAIAGLDAQIQELQDKRKELTRMSPGLSGVASSIAAPARKRAAVTASTSSPAKKKRKVSAATRKKLKDAAKARWARIRSERGG
jgi:Arc/MetJ-type ribon-helix-helix transcriptional regulator